MSTQNIFFIQELKIEALIGHKVWEKKLKQQLFIDVEFYFTNIPAHFTYQHFINSIQEFFNDEHFENVETIAQLLSKHLHHKFLIQNIKLTLTRPKLIAQLKAYGLIFIKDFA